MKKFAMLMVALTMLFALTACGSKDEGTTPPDGQTQEETQVETETQGEENTDAEAETAEFTGVLEEKKDFMVIVNSEDGKDSYIFTLEDGVTCDAEAGDKVTVTYTGDLANYDPAGDVQLLATQVVKAAE